METCPRCKCPLEYIPIDENPGIISYFMVPEEGNKKVSHTFHCKKCNIRYKKDPEGFKVFRYYAKYTPGTVTNITNTKCYIAIDMISFSEKNLLLKEHLKHGGRYGFIIKNEKINNRIDDGQYYPDYLKFEIPTIINNDIRIGDKIDFIFIKGFDFDIFF